MMMARAKMNCRNGSIGPVLSLSVNSFPHLAAYEIRLAIDNKKANSRHPHEVRCWPALWLVGPCAKRLACALSTDQSLVNMYKKRPTPSYPLRVLWCWLTLRLVRSCAKSLPFALPAKLASI
jgi:hypothetical protein